MTTQTEALKLALEALSKVGYVPDAVNPHPISIAITAIKEALAQPEQEPVAWMDIDEKGFGYGLRYWSEPDNRHEVPLYTTPPQRTWVGLTDDEMRLIDPDGFEDNLPQMIQQALKEKNT